MICTKFGENAIPVAILLNWCTAIIFW